MSNATEPTAPQTQTQTREPSPLEELLNKPARARLERITFALNARAEDIERLLPDFMKGQAARLIARARQYFARGSWQLQECSEASFVKCVLEAAELGFAIDGKMVHAVPRLKKKKENGQWYEWYEAGTIPDYKSLIAVAKRSKIIQDAWARIIYETDQFTYEEQDGKVIYHHVPDFRRERDSLDGAILVLAVATHRDGWYRTEVMPTADVLKIRSRSASFKDADSKTPWNTDPGEMSKKTCLKRLLKTFADDPGLIRLMELDDRDYQETEHAEPTHGTSGGEEGSEGMATPASSPSTPLTATQKLAAKLKEQTGGTVLGAVLPADHIVAIPPAEHPKETMHDEGARLLEESRRNFPGPGTPTKPAAEPSTPRWPMKDIKGKLDIDWAKANAEQRTEYTCERIAVAASEGKNAPDVKPFLETLRNIGEKVTERAIGKEGYARVMQEITVAERTLMQAQASDDASPFDSDGGEVEDDEIAALQDLLQACETPEHVNELEGQWNNHEAEHTKEVHAYGLRLIAEKREPIA
jgi:phage RecT family recombinase